MEVTLEDLPKIETPHYLESEVESKAIHDVWFSPEGEVVDCCVQCVDDIFLILPYSVEQSKSVNLNVYKGLRKNHIRHLQQEFSPASKTVFVVDCLVDQGGTSRRDILGEEKDETSMYSIGTTRVGYYFNEDDLHIINVDHHSKTDRYEGVVSSHDPASAFPRLKKDISGIPLFITHTDPDSILSVMMMRGMIPPKMYDEYARAVEASDHTGAQTDLGDLISAMQVENNLELSLRITKAYIAYRMDETVRKDFTFDSFLEYLADQGINIHDGQSEMTIKEAVENYRQKRVEGRTYFPVPTDVKANWNVYKNKIWEGKNGWTLQYFGNGVFLVDNEADTSKAFFDNELLAYLIPEELKSIAKVVLFSRQMPDDEHGKPRTDRYEVKARVVPEWIGKINLKKLGIDVPPYNLGCRHNAGSTFRDGGTHLHGKDLAKKISSVIGSVTTT